MSVPGHNLLNEGACQKIIGGGHPPHTPPVEPSLISRKDKGHWAKKLLSPYFIEESGSVFLSVIGRETGTKYCSLDIKLNVVYVIIRPMSDNVLRHLVRFCKLFLNLH